MQLFAVVSSQASEGNGEQEIEEPDVDIRACADAASWNAGGCVKGDPVEEDPPAAAPPQDLVR